MAIRTAIARLREDQDEYLLNLSAPMVGDSVDVVLVIKGFGSFLTSGSSALRKAFSLPGMEVSKVFLKNSGPLSQLDSARSFGCRLHVARSAGLLELSTYLHSSGDEIFRIVWTRFAT